MVEVAEDPHRVYVNRLKYIGRMLGFETKGLDTQVGVLDCIWRYKESNRFFKPKASDDIYGYQFVRGLPLVAFEVIFCEKTKMLRGSILNMLSSKPSLAVFVFLRKARKQQYPDEDVDATERSIERICQEVASFLRTSIWHEEEVDELYSELTKGTT
jgi:hypothetical protein